MKKITKLVLVLLFSMFLNNCSKKEESPTVTTPTENLFVNGIVFPVGNENTNITVFSPGSVPGSNNTRSFIIVKKTTTSTQDSESITINILYPLNQPSINGIYNVNPTFIAQPESLAVCNFSGYNMGFQGPQPTNSPATIKVTNNGNNNYKLEFNNVILKSGNETKTITGFLVANFKQN